MKYIWDQKAYRYTIVESPSDEVENLDHYVFIVRARIDRDTKETTYYTDIKSESLRKVLRTVLQGVDVISLDEAELSIEQHLTVQARSTFNCSSTILRIPMRPRPNTWAHFYRAARLLTTCYGPYLNQMPSCIRPAPVRAALNTLSTILGSKGRQSPV